MGWDVLAQLFSRKLEEGSHIQDGQMNSSRVHLPETAEKQLQWAE